MRQGQLLRALKYGQVPSDLDASGLFGIGSLALNTPRETVRSYTEERKLNKTTFGRMHPNLLEDNVSLHGNLRASEITCQLRKQGLLGHGVPRVRIFCRLMRGGIES